MEKPTCPHALCVTFATPSDHWQPKKPTANPQGPTAATKNNKNVCGLLNVTNVRLELLEVLDVCGKCWTYVTHAKKYARTPKTKTHHPAPENKQKQQTITDKQPPDQPAIKVNSTT